MKFMLQLLGSLVFVVLAQQATAACPTNLTAEKLIECIIAENDCLEGSSLQQTLAFSPAASSAVITIVAETASAQDKIVLATTRAGDQ